MQMDVIERIRAAEAKADEIIRQASASARETVSAAGKEAYNAELGVDALAQKEVEKAHCRGGGRGNAGEGANPC